MSSPSERLAFSLDETSVDPSARSSITPTQSLDSIVRGRALKPKVQCAPFAPIRLAEHTHAALLMIAGKRHRSLIGLAGRAIIDDDDLIMGVVKSGERP